MKPIPSFVVRLALLSSYCLVASTSLLAADRPWILVSDIDDTLKVTNVGRKLDALKNGLFTRVSFGGMAQVLNELQGAAREQVDQVSTVYLSGSPTFLRPKLRKFLWEGGFPVGRMILKNLFRDGFSNPYYKDSKLEALAAPLPPSTFVLVGDDTEHDPDVYSRFNAAFFQQHEIQSTYIHYVTGRELPHGEIHYFNAFDIATHEYRAGRLSAAAAQRVGEAVLSSSDRRFKPLFVSCDQVPQRETEGLTGELFELQNRIVTRWVLICAHQKELASQGLLDAAIDAELSVDSEAL